MIYILRLRKVFVKKCKKPYNSDPIYKNKDILWIITLSFSISVLLADYYIVIFKRNTLYLSNITMWLRFICLPIELFEYYTQPGCGGIRKPYNSDIPNYVCWTWTARNITEYIWYNILVIGRLNVENVVLYINAPFDVLSINRIEIMRLGLQQREYTNNSVQIIFSVMFCISFIYYMYHWMFIECVQIIECMCWPLILSV